jgi:hypothetical protein
MDGLSVVVGVFGRFSRFAHAVIFVEVMRSKRVVEGTKKNPDTSHDRKAVDGGSETFRGARNAVDRVVPFLTRSAVAACVDRSALREIFGELTLSAREWGETRFAVPFAFFVRLTWTNAKRTG